MRLEIWDGNILRLSIPMDFIPKSNAIIRECYETPTEIIICGYPKDDDGKHNCDAMGCSASDHVLYRLKKEAINETN
jgi:hypothetical protein